MSLSSIVFVGIAPHPPIMVPEVGGADAAEVRASINAMRVFTERIIACGAETVVIVSPHAPLEPDAFVAYADAELTGDFANFRAPGATVSAPLDRELLDSLSAAALEDGFYVLRLEGHTLDHGTTVPLYFLLRNNWRGRVVALGYSFLSNEEHVRFGACVRRAADALARNVAFVASGDLSHRLKPGAPAGFHPEAHLFDEEIVEAVRACAPGRIAGVGQGLRRTAGECGYRSMLVAVGVSESLPPACEVLHYEAPFGVGYMVAQLSAREDAGDARSDAASKSSSTDDDAIKSESVRAVESPSSSPADEILSDDEALLLLLLPALARRAVETFVRERRVIEPPQDLESPTLQIPAACFVSLKTDDGSLRGCIGTVEPTQGSLAEELIANAVSAATRDPRFPPVGADELPRLRYSVDVLSEPEPARFQDLDPKVFGVIVEDEQGFRRGLLLPDIEGVESALQQVEIAARKAGISTAGSPLKLSRFRVRRFSERGRFDQTTEQGAET